MNVKTIVSNPAMKILALVLAIGYWVLVSAPRRERLLDRSFDVPLAFVGLPRDLIITTPVRETVSVRLRGRLTPLRSLTSQNLEATLDLSNVMAGGEVGVPVLPQSINVPPGIEVIAIDPPKVTLRLEPRRQKIVPIREFLVGQLPSGYGLGAVTVNPPNALVSGPLSLVRNVSEVATERIILSGRTATFQLSVGLVSDNPLVVVVEPPTAVITVEVNPPPPPPPPPGASSTSPPP